MEKVIIFGTGKRTQLIFEFLNKYNEFDVIEIWDNDDFIVGTLSEVKGDKNRQKMIDLITKDNIKDPETLILAASDIADGIEL